MTSSSPTKLEALAEKIRDAKQPKTHTKKRFEDRGLGLVFRLMVELLGCTGVATGLGYVVDQALGWFPWLSVACLFMGLTAGVMTMYRTAQSVMKTPTPTSSTSSSLK